MPARTVIDFQRRYGRLAIIEELSPRTSPSGKSYRVVLCKCLCGTEKAYALDTVHRGVTQSCGCISPETRRRNSDALRLSARGLPQRFWEKVDKHGPPPSGAPSLGACWLWRGALSDGYGVWWVARANKPAHVSAYVDARGPLPDGMQLDHLCRVRSCCNPAHLEPVSCRTNLLRGDTLAAANAKKTHCPKGHALADSNLYVHDGRRACLRCRRDTSAAWNRRNKRPPNVG